MERMGFPTAVWGYGRGGSSPNHPEYDRRLALLREARFEYLERFPADRRYIEAGVERVPVDWVNQRLREIGETWQVMSGPNGLLLPDLPNEGLPADD